MCTKTIEEILFTVQRAVDEAALEAHRPKDSVAMMAVTKGFPGESILPLVRAGHTLFGESRVPEALAKWPSLRPFGTVRLHLIGPLQTNKVRKALTLFDVIETVDRPSLVERLAVGMRERGRSTECLIQVNTGREPQKAGIYVEDMPELLALCREKNVPVTGLMCVPPKEEEPSLHFALLRTLAGKHGLSQLSMGMSTDYMLAVRFGATRVRLGTALLGVRPVEGG